MPQLESIPKSFKQVESVKSSARIHLQTEDLDDKFDFTFEAVRPNLFRTTFTSKTHPLPPYSSISQQKRIDSKLHRFELGKSSCSFDTGDVTASIEWSHAPVVSLRWGDSNELLHSDLPFRPYVVDGSGIAHYMQHDRDALHVGLGEKSAPMDLTARHFQISATDCFGYDAYATDPMYKRKCFHLLQSLSLLTRCGSRVALRH